MRYEEDYRFCVTAALQIMQQQRKKLYQDCVEYEPTIYSGLHSSDSKSVRHLYFQSYFIEWISLHWESMIEILNRHDEYTVDQRKEMALFFAKYFSDLISECSSNGIRNYPCMTFTICVKTSLAVRRAREYCLWLIS